MGGAGRPASERGVTRREALRLAAGFAGLVAAGAMAQGCGGAPASRDDGPVRVALASIPDAGRIRVRVAGEPVELSRTGRSVTARSLRCTHWGCTVAWNDRENVYDCPCHDGRFAPDGRVISGPPQRPLRDVAVLVDGDAVVVLPRDGAPV